MSLPRLVFDGVTGGYGSAPVVREVSGQVAPGETLCVLGRNGTGKTTLMRLLMGYLRCWQGSVRLDGTSIETLTTPARHALGISYCPQEWPVFDDLSVRDNLTLMRPNRDLAPFADCLARFPILARRLDQHAGTLSGGEKKLLSLTRGLAEALPMMLLDEPSEGLAPIVVQRIAKLLRYLRDTGATVLLAEQNMHFCLGIASHATVIDKGQIVYRDTIDALRQDEAVKSRYLAL